MILDSSRTGTWYQCSVWHRFNRVTHGQRWLKNSTQLQHSFIRGMVSNNYSAFNGVWLLTLNSTNIFLFTVTVSENTETKSCLRSNNTYHNNNMWTFTCENDTGLMTLFFQTQLMALSWAMQFPFVTRIYLRYVSLPLVLKPEEERDLTEHENSA